MRNRHGWLDDDHNEARGRDEERYPGQRGPRWDEAYRERSERGVSGDPSYGHRGNYEQMLQREDHRYFQRGGQDDRTRGWDARDRDGGGRGHGGEGRQDRGWESREELGGQRYHGQPQQGGFGSQGGYGSQGGSGHQGGFGQHGGFGPQGGFGPHSGYGQHGGFGSHSGYGQHGGFGPQGGFGSHSGYGQHGGFGPQGGFGPHSGYGQHGGFGSHSGYGQHGGFGSHSGYGQHSGFGPQGGFGNHSGHGQHGGFGQGAAGPLGGFADEPGRMSGAEGSFRPRGRPPKGYKRSDERIREDLCDQISEHPDLDASDVEVKVQGGEVVLSGIVRERRFKHLLEAMAERISGVSDVRNEIRVQREESNETRRSAGPTSGATAGTSAGASNERNAGSELKSNESRRNAS